MLYRKVLDATVPADDGTTVSLGYCDFCKPRFYSYEKWKHVPVGVQIRMCEYLELEFPLLSLAEDQWASVVFLSGYFRRVHCSGNNGSHPSAGYQVPILEDDEDEQLQEELKAAELSDVSQREDHSAWPFRRLLHISTSSLRQLYCPQRTKLRVQEGETRQWKKKDGSGCTPYTHENRRRTAPLVPLADSRIRPRSGTLPESQGRAGPGRPRVEGISQTVRLLRLSRISVSLKGGR
ncbi:hypothetical protein V1522DRAFT_414201 [Lipomyces starkeyi]